jgi:hypothetical protein
MMEFMVPIEMLRSCPFLQAIPEENQLSER